MKIHVSDLEGVALDWATGIASGKEIMIDGDRILRLEPFVVELPGRPDFIDNMKYRYSPSSSWADCGPLIDEFNIWLRGPVFDGDGCAADFCGDRTKRGFGPAQLTAVCRAFVSAKLGEEIEIPDELMEPRT